MKLKTVLFLLPFFELCFAQNVIVVVVDGARYTETFGAGATYIPHMYNDLKPIGAVYTNFRIADAGITVTNPGHASILTGTWQLIANNGWERPNKPTVFEYFRKELNSSMTENYVIAGKSKLEVISYSTDPSYGSLYQASTNCSTVSDNQVYNNLVTIMDTYHPRLIIVNLPDTDVRGDASDWNGYLSAITDADNLVYQLWQKIQTDPFYQNNTTLFVTNDHGRHTTDYTSHGDGCDGCEHIMLLAVGRNVTQGLVNNDLHYQIDITPTVGDLLNFSTPQTIGISLYEGSNPLPAELSSFSASIIGSKVKLNWRTETEVNNYGFDVERKTKNDRNETWEKIGFVNGNGNSNSPEDYSFTDKNKLYGNYAYRLKQIDNDGKYEYSSIIEIDLGNPSEYSLEQNYPNPFNPNTTISFSLPEKSNVTLSIYNSLGELVEVLANSEFEAGRHTFNWNATNYSSGIYFCTIQTKVKTISRKMLLLK